MLEDQLQSAPKLQCRPAPETTDGGKGARLKRSRTLCSKVLAFALDCSGLCLAHQVVHVGPAVERIVLIRASVLERPDGYMRRRTCLSCKAVNSKKPLPALVQKQVAFAMLLVAVHFNIPRCK